MRFMGPGELSAMQGFFNVHEEQKVGPWLEPSGSRSAFQRSIRCLWWQSVLLLSYVIVGSSAKTPFADTSLDIQSSIDSESQLKSLIFDVQQQISKMPFWKLHALSKVLHGRSRSGWIKHFPKSTKLHKHKMIKRAVSNLDFDDPELQSLLEEAVKNAVRSVLSGRKVLSNQSKMLDPKPNDDNGEHPSDSHNFPINYLRRDSHSNIDGLQPQPSQESDTLMLDQDMLDTSTSKPGDTSYVYSSEHQSRALSKLESEGTSNPGSLISKSTLEWSTVAPLVTHNPNDLLLPSSEQDSLQTKTMLHSTVKINFVSNLVETSLPSERDQGLLQSTSAMPSAGSTMNSVPTSQLDDLIRPSSEQDSSSKPELQKEGSTMKTVPTDMSAKTFLHTSKEPLKSKPKMEMEWSTISSPSMSKPESTLDLALNEQGSLQPNPDLQLELSTMQSYSASSSSVYSSSEQVSNSELSTLKTLLRSSPVLTPLHLFRKPLSESQPALQLTQSVTELPILKAQSPGLIEIRTESTDSKTLVDVDVTTAHNFDHTISLKLPKALNVSPITQSDTSAYTPDFVIISPSSQKSDLVTSADTRVVQRPSVLSTKETSISFTLNSDSPYTTLLKHTMGESLEMEYTSINAIIPYNVDSQMQTIFHPTQDTYMHTSFSAETSEHDGFRQKIKPLHTSTSTPSEFLGSIEVSIMPTDAVSFQLDYETVPNDTPLPIQGRDHPACVLKIQESTTAPMLGMEKSTSLYAQTDSSHRLSSMNTGALAYKLSELSRTKRSSLNLDTLPYQPSELSSTVTYPVFTVTASPDLFSASVMERPSPVPTESFIHSSTFSIFADQVSSEPTESTTIAEFDTLFHDEINGDGNFKDLLPHSKSTQSSRTLLPWYSKQVTPEPQELNFSKGNQYITVSGPAAITQKLDVASSALSMTKKRGEDSSSYAITDHSTIIEVQKSLSTSPTQIPIMDSTKPTGSLNPSLPVKYSSISPFVTFTAEMYVTPQPTSKNQDYSIFPITPRPTNFNVPTTQAISIMTNPKSVFSQPDRSSTAVTYASTPGEAAITLAPKVWIPLSSDKIQTASTTTPPAVTVPLNFHLAGISYNDELRNKTSETYQRLEQEVVLLLNKVFAAKYQQEYRQVKVLGFLQGSVIVKSNLEFDGQLPTPSGSDIVRTVISDNTIKNNYFGWNINSSTVECQGFSPKNLESELLSFSFLVLRAGSIAVSQKSKEKQNFLESLQREILQAINTSFPVTNVSFSQVRDVHGDLEVRGTFHVNSARHTDLPNLIACLTPLAQTSVDLQSITIDSTPNELLVQPITFRLTNKQFVSTLLDVASSDFQELSKDLSLKVQSALQDDGLLQVIIREFQSGSVLCKGHLVYRPPAPGSGEILRQFQQSLRSDGMLGSSDYRVDAQSIRIGDSSSRPYHEYIDFPGYGVAIIVMCGLCILLSPVLVFVCYKTRMLGHKQKATIQRRHDRGQQRSCFEMDNQAFRSSIEQP